MNKLGYFLLLIAGIACFGGIGICTRKLTDLGLNLPMVAFFRMFIASIVLFIILLIFKRKSLVFHKRDIWIFVLVGLFKALSDLFLFSAQTNGPLAIASLLQLTSPYFVMIISVFLFKENITVKKVIAVLIAVTGCVLATGILYEKASVGSIAIVAGLCSGLFYAFYTISTKSTMDREYTPETVLLYAFIFGTIFTIPFIGDYDTFTSAFLNSEILMWAVILAIVMTLIPFFIFNLSISKLGVTITSMADLLEIVFSAMFGFFIFDEHLGIMNFIGILLILVSIALISLRMSERMKAKSIENKLDAVIIDGTATTEFIDKIRRKRSN